MRLVLILISSCMLVVSRKKAESNITEAFDTRSYVEGELNQISIARLNLTDMRNGSRVVVRRIPVGSEKYRLEEFGTYDIVQ